MCSYYYKKYKYKKILFDSSWGIKLVREGFSAGLKWCGICEICQMRSLAVSATASSSLCQMVIRQGDAFKIIHLYEYLYGLYHTSPFGWLPHCLRMYDASACHIDSKSRPQHTNLSITITNHPAITPHSTHPPYALYLRQKHTNLKSQNPISNNNPPSYSTLCPQQPFTPKNNPTPPKEIRSRGLIGNGQWL